jgi:Ca2+-binding RTX toxin-like protein
MRTVVVTAVAFALVAPSAEAATVTSTPTFPGDHDVVYRAQRGETNHVSIAVSPTTVTIADPGIAIVTRGDGGCQAMPEGPVVCTVTDQTVVQLFLGDGADTSRAAGGTPIDHVEVNGGVGDDDLQGSEGEDWLNGDDGEDTIRAGAGQDQIDGGRGTDGLSGGADEDLAEFGNGDGQRVNVTLDGRANDGAPAERDALSRDVEDINVSEARSGSQVIGNGKANDIILSARGVAVGGGGDDSLIAAGTARGGKGDDKIEALGRGKYYGGPGDDSLSKSADEPGSALLDGGPGNDIVDAVDQDCTVECGIDPFPDNVVCGSGRDRALLDVRDRVLSGCERVRTRRD